MQPEFTLSHRFIPARAGNTRSGQTQSGSHSVHPRSRGEHLLDIEVAGASNGSSPLARGTRFAQDEELPVFRFIPARAGNTTARVTAARANAVHPRSRGEHASHAAVTVEIAGSSPLARGTRASFPALDRSRRFIPARAGNTSASSSSGSQPSGSSPLARGTRAG